MRILTLVLCVLLVAGDAAWACSAFSTNMDGEQVVAKNFDWFTGEGYLVVNQRGRERETFLGRGKPWVSRYGSVSLTIIGPGFPVSGMNEKGLVVESLVNHSASAKTGDGELGSLEWVQFALDRFATVKDLRASLRDNTPTQLVIPLHFFACDAGGDCMVVEPEGNRLRVIAGQDLKAPIVANRDWRVDYKDAKAHADSPWQRLVTPSYKSHARYSTIYQKITGRKNLSKDDVFSVLENARISQINRWQIVWNQDRGQMTYRIRDDDADGEFRRLSLAKLDFACGGEQRVQDLATTQKHWRVYRPADRDVVAARVNTLVGVRSARAPGRFATDVADHTLTSRCARKTVSN